MRVTNRLLAGLLALALLAGGLLAAAEIVYGSARGRPLVVPWDDWFDGARDHAWSSRDARVLLVVLLAVGVALLALQVLRRGPQSLPVAADESRALTVEANTHSLERALGRAVTAVDGVAKARVSLSRARARVEVRTSRREIGGLELAVRQAVDARLATAGVRPPDQVHVRVRRTKEAQQAVKSASVPPAGVTPSP
ncbi:MAG TPA: DUF6286 domain-containing protein [Acidimicrobiales bacterium]|nr:DUF6286 domain-containing protein [Acidimicrobiales bacterium]